jgi:hypothetical protein
MSNLVNRDVITRCASDTSDVDESSPDVPDPEVLNGLGGTRFAHETTIKARLITTVASSEARGGDADLSVWIAAARDTAGQAFAASSLQITMEVR